MRQLAVAGIALAVLLALDLGFRRIPNAVAYGMLGGGILAGLVGAGAWSWAGMLVGAVLVLAGGFPGGDVKAAAVLGGFAGLHAITLAVGIAFTLTLCSWRFRLTPRPWLVYVAVGMAVAACSQAVLLL